MTPIRKNNRRSWITAAGLAATALVLAMTMPSLIAYAAMWSACRIDCSALGWQAIAYAPAFGYIASSTALAVLGMKSYRIVTKLVAERLQRRLQIAFGVGAAAAMIAMAGSAYLPITNQLLGTMISQIALHG